MRGDPGRFEQSADEFLPYLGHIKSNVVALEDGSLMAMVVSPGLPFELDDNGARNARPHRFNSLTQMIGDDNVTIHSNFIHGDVEPQLVTEGRFLTRFCARRTTNTSARRSATRSRPTRGCCLSSCIRAFRSKARSTG